MQFGAIWCYLVQFWGNPKRFDAIWYNVAQGSRPGGTRVRHGGRLGNKNVDCFSIETGQRYQTTWAPNPPGIPWKPAGPHLGNGAIQYNAAIWCNLVQFWCNLVRFGASWYNLIQFGSILVQSGAILVKFWCNPMQLICCKLVKFGTICNFGAILCSLV